MSAWHLLKSVVASVLVKKQQWQLKAILNVVHDLVLKKEWIFSSMLHWYWNCKLPVKGSVVSQLICLHGFLVYEVHYFCCSFSWFIFSSFSLPKLSMPFSVMRLSCLPLLFISFSSRLPLIFIVFPEQFQGSYLNTVPNIGHSSLAELLLVLSRAE